MTRFQPRLPELAGMTEAGFNRVVAMIQPWDLWVHHQCTRPWGWDFPLGCVSCQGFLDSWNAWRASLPKTRNKRQRKADARKTFSAMLDTLPEVSGMLAARDWHAPTAQEALDTLNQGIREAYEQTTKPYVPRTPLQFHQPHVPEDVKRVQEGILQAWKQREIDTVKPWSHWYDQTPLQRLLKFAAEDGTPVSFEIAEKAMKGEW